MPLNLYSNTRTFDFVSGQIPYEFSIHPLFLNKVETWATMYSDTEPVIGDLVRMRLTDCIGTFEVSIVNSEKEKYRVKLKMILQEC